MDTVYKLTVRKMIVYQMIVCKMNGYSLQDTDMNRYEQFAR